MLLNDSKKGPPHVHYRRPYGCAVLAMSDVLHTISELKEEKDFVLKVYTWVSGTCVCVFLKCMVDAREDPLVIDDVLYVQSGNVLLLMHSSVSVLSFFLRQQNKSSFVFCFFFKPFFRFLTKLHPCLLINGRNKNIKYLQTDFCPLVTTDLSDELRPLGTIMPCHIFLKLLFADMQCQFMCPDIYSTCQFPFISLINQNN